MSPPVRGTTPPCRVVDYVPQIIASLNMCPPPLPLRLSTWEDLKALRRDGYEPHMMDSTCLPLPFSTSVDPKPGKGLRRDDYEPHMICSQPMYHLHPPLRPLTPKYGKE